MSSLPSYTIFHKGIKLEILILNIRDLHLHEEVLSELLDRLVDEIKQDGVLKHPVIVDERSLVVLDGMHRVAALEVIGCVRVPVCLIDYEDPAFEVGCWYRTVGKGGWAGVFNGILRGLQMNFEEVSLEKAKEVVKTGLSIAIVTGEKGFCVKSDVGSLKEAYDLVKKVELKLREMGCEVGYETEFDAGRKLREGVVDAVIMTPPVDKGSVVRVALAGQVFVHKTTRHVIPARPLGVNVPLKFLSSHHSSLFEVNKELVGLLEKRTLKHIPPWSIVEGRRYEEDLFVFE